MRYAFEIKKYKQACNFCIKKILGSKLTLRLISGHGEHQEHERPNLYFELYFQILGTPGYGFLVGMLVIGSGVFNSHSFFLSSTKFHPGVFFRH